MEDKSKEGSINDFELGGDDGSTQGPTINKYNGALSEAPATTESIKSEPAKVDPTDTSKPLSTNNTQTVAPAATPAPVSPTSQTPPATKPLAAGQNSVTPTQTSPSQAGSRQMPMRPAGSPPDPAARRRALLGCTGGFAVVMLILLVMSFVFLAGDNTEASPMARLLGVDQASFVNGLITFVHIIFIFIALFTFVFTMIGLFKASMAKKDDKLARKDGLKMALTAGIMLFIILVIWAFVYLYLDSKRIAVSPEFLDPIVTDPEETLDLSAPIEIKFDAANVPIDRDKYQIVSHEWDFGDGETGTSQIVSHIYSEKGTYDVTLIVNVKNKNTGELSVGGEYHLTVSITNQALAAIFSADPQSGEAPLKVKFDATDSVDPDGNISRYEWDLDNDGEFDDAEGITTEQEFKKIGKYLVSLRVTSTTGEFDVSEKEISVVEESGPDAVITVTDDPKAYYPGVSYVFKSDDSASPNGKIETYTWDFSDSSKTEKTKTVSHTFNNTGTYEVTLTVKDETGEEGEVSMTIVVSSPKGTPKAVISTTPAISGVTQSLTGKLPFKVSFDGGNSTDSDNNIIDYQWDFNSDGKADAFGEKTTYTFSNEGTSVVTLLVVDADDNVGKASISVTAEAQGIIPKVEADKVEGNVPLTIEFDASGSTYSGGQITSYRWDFGDGTEPKLGAAQINHKYTSIGSYTTTVTVIGADNTTATAQINITVREIPLSACFTSVFEKGPAPLENIFDASCSTGTITSYLWNFGDGSSSTQVKPSHTYTKAGNYTVTLEISDADSTVSRASSTILVTE